MAGVGTVISALLLPRLRRTLGFGPCWIGSFVLCAAAVAVLAFAGSVAVAAAVAPVFFFGLALAGISGMTLRQTITPDHLLGRVTAAFWTIHGSLGPIGAALLTAAVERFGVRGPLLVVCGLFALVSLVAVATPIRQRHPVRAAGRGSGQPVRLPHQRDDLVHHLGELVVLRREHRGDALRLAAPSRPRAG